MQFCETGRGTKLAAMVPDARAESEEVADVLSDSDLSDGIVDSEKTTNNAETNDEVIGVDDMEESDLDEPEDEGSDLESEEGDASGDETVRTEFNANDEETKATDAGDAESGEDEADDEETAEEEERDAKVDGDENDTEGARKTKASSHEHEELKGDLSGNALAAGSAITDAAEVTVSKDVALMPSKTTRKPHINALPKRPKPTSGVVYVSRVPPGMDVGALRSLLGRAGKIGRVWLRPESSEMRKERKALGSSRGRGEFMDGWVEFPKRHDAKRVVALLNRRPMAGAKRRGRWADDLWNLKLLRGYTWNDLVEETCSGTRERTLRVKAEVAAARREKAFVEERVAMARRIEKDDGEKKPVRYFRQKRAIADREWEEDVDERRAREAMKRVDEELDTGKAKPIDKELLGMLFKKRRTGEKDGTASR